MSTTTQTNNKTIAKNTLMLYARMLFMMIIGLYTSRVILDKLGEVDFGIYNVVGGFVTMFTVISGAMTTATQRFLSFEIGKGKDGNVKSIFSTMVYIHLFLALIIFIVGETLGTWFLNTQMNFPLDRYGAANWVFQFSLITFIISVIGVPYNGALIAYEKMSAFAYFSIFEAVFKLLICYIITLTIYDKLSFYAFLMAVIQGGLIFFYYIYCRINFKECRVGGKLNRDYSREVTSFVSWNLIGSLAGVLKEQGVNVVLNMFFGPTVNAARGVAYQVLTKVNGFATNFQMAMNPQIIKNYASGAKDDMFKLVFRGAKLSYLLLLMLSLPIIIEAPLILGVWLKEVPDYTVIFLRIIMFTSMLNALSNPLITSMHASGKVRDYQIVVGGISLLTLPLVYVGFKVFSLEPYYAMIIAFAVEFVCHIARLYMLVRSIEFPMWNFLKNVTFRVIFITLLALICPTVFHIIINADLYRFLAVGLASIISTFLFGFYFGFNKQERMYMKSKAIVLISKKLKI